MSSKRRTYPRAFKLEAVQLSQEGDEAFRGQGRQTSDEEELRQLRRENALLKQERDILKKALAIFTPRLR